MPAMVAHGGQQKNGSCLRGKGRARCAAPVFRLAAQSASRSVGFCGHSHYRARWSQSGSGRDPAPKRSRRGSLDDTHSPADRCQRRTHVLQRVRLEPEWASESQQPLHQRIQPQRV